MISRDPGRPHDIAVNTRCWTTQNSLALRGVSTTFFTPNALKAQSRHRTLVFCVSLSVRIHILPVPLVIERTSREAPLPSKYSWKRLKIEIREIALVQTDAEALMASLRLTSHGIDRPNRNKNDLYTSKIQTRPRLDRSE